MPQHLKALVVVLLLGTMGFALARQPVCAAGMRPDDFARRCKTWYLVTVAVFLAHNYWLYVCVVGGGLYLAHRKERNPTALFLLLIWAVPAIPKAVPGFGIVNYLIDIHFVRVLSLVLLLPAFLRRNTQATWLPVGRLATDRYVVAFAAVGFLAWLRVFSVTDSLRNGVVYALLDVLLPYLIASRLARDPAQLRDALLALLLGAAPAAAISIFEFAKHWLLYTSLADALGVRWAPWDLTMYLSRADYLRAQAAAGHPIMLAQGLVVALGCAVLAVVRAGHRSLSAWALAGLIAAGLVAPLSRAPWLGAGLLLAAMVVLLPSTRRFVLPAVALGVMVAVGSLVAGKSGWLDYLPFVGTVEAENIDYRHRLIEASIGVILQNPLFGSPFFMYDPAMQDMKQGQGIIDLVNTYLGIGLSSGLVGLAIYVGGYATALVAAFRVRLSRGLKAESLENGAVLLSVMLASLFIIATTSLNAFTTSLLAALLGLLAGYGSATNAEPKRP